MAMSSVLPVVDVTASCRRSAPVSSTPAATRPESDVAEDFKRPLTGACTMVETRRSSP